MVINSSGNVGINNNSPYYKLDVSGDSRVVGKCIVQTNNSQNGVVCTGTSGGYSYYGYQDGDPGIKFTRTSVFTGEDSEYTLAILPAPGGTPRPNAINLGSSSVSDASLGTSVLRYWITSMFWFRNGQNGHG